MIANRLSEMKKQNGPHAADATRRALSAFFNWARREGLPVSNPVRDTNRPVRPTKRKRFLKPAELVEVWNALEDDEYGRIIKLLILTGQRREEIAALTWAEVDLDDAMITFRDDRTKNDEDHLVPLSDQALAILREIPRRADRDFLFGKREGPFSGFSKAKRELIERINAKRLVAGPRAEPIEHFTQHDLRRTFSTLGQEELDIDSRIVEAILNHISGHKAGVAGVYNRAKYIRQRREALVQWGNYVLSLTTHDIRQADGRSPP
jgi:integrase